MFGGFFEYFVGEKSLGHFCIIREDFCIFKGEKVGEIVYHLRGYFSFFELFLGRF
jgi:hypothetical protein